MRKTGQIKKDCFPGRCFHSFLNMEFRRCLCMNVGFDSSHVSGNGFVKLKSLSIDETEIVFKRNKEGCFFLTGILLC